MHDLAKLEVGHDSIASPKVMRVNHYVKICVLHGTNAMHLETDWTRLAQPYPMLELTTSILHGGNCTPSSKAIRISSVKTSQLYEI